MKKQHTMKKSRFYYYLFQKNHEIIGNRKLFKFQTELAILAVKIPETSFFQKNVASIRPFLNQQLKSDGEPHSKPIRNHFNMYSKVVLARFKQLKQNITQDELESILEEFKEFFSKEPVDEEGNPLPPLKGGGIYFDYVTADLLQSLHIVAIANGGTLTQKEFSKALENLKNKTS